MEYLQQVDSPEHETAEQRRMRVQLIVATGAVVHNMPLFGLGGSGLYLKNPQEQVMQI
ncbi:MAG TPA: hypothetical protein PKU78_02810 [Candidatus Dojkabacteria bacterium]|nr:hypothetical protein [Candidatus Dojkabacteria bacterium]HRO65124.1 hypothetical protein [Candidatus Dojkabacteria bacterium]HRP36879.1 hypothetical protein [Candidatus Dojkabacteria bacterium]HRP51675.1 hypothetical protein [Candidatus Dojkabacteria bacterium]